MGEQKDDHVAHIAATGDGSSPDYLLGLSPKRRGSALPRKERYHIALRSHTFLPFPLEDTWRRVVCPRPLDPYRIGATSAGCKQRRVPGDAE